MNNLKHNMRELFRDVLRETLALLILFSIFIFNPFFNSLFRTDIHLLLKTNLCNGLPFSDHPLLAVNYQIPAIQTEQFMVASRDVISIRAFNKKAHE